MFQPKDLWRWGCVWRLSWWTKLASWLFFLCHTGAAFKTTSSWESVTILSRKWSVFLFSNSPIRIYLVLHAFKVKALKLSLAAVKRNITKKRKITRESGPKWSKSCLNFQQKCHFCTILTSKLPNHIQCYVTSNHIMCLTCNWKPM